MWSPVPKWQTQAAQQAALAPPGVEAGCSPLATVWFPTALLPQILGALQQLVQPAIWNTATPLLTQEQMTDLIGNIATAAQTSYHTGTPISCGDASCNWIRNSAGQFILNQ